MKLMDLANKFVKAVKEGQEQAFVDEHYATDIVSVEAAEMPGSPRVINGLKAMREKWDRFEENFEVHNMQVEGPWPHGDDKFAVRMSFDMTHRASGHRRQADEIAVFHLTQGKVSREEYFYAD